MRFKNLYWSRIVSLQEIPEEKLERYPLTNDIEEDKEAMLLLEIEDEDYF